MTENEAAIESIELVQDLLEVPQFPPPLTFIGQRSLERCKRDRETDSEGFGEKPKSPLRDAASNGGFDRIPQLKK